MARDRQELALEEPVIEQSNLPAVRAVCAWDSIDGAVRVHVDVYEHASGGLALPYRHPETYSVFVPDEVDGTPVVRTSEPGSSMCELLVGPSPDQLMSLVVSQVRVVRQVDTCALAYDVTRRVLANLPPLT